MTLPAFMAEFSGYYTRSSTVVKRKVEAFVSHIAEPDLDRLLDGLQEEFAPKDPAGVKEVAAICRASGIPFKESVYIPAIDVDCASCGYRYKFAYHANDDTALDKHVFCYCPRCGFHHEWTLQMRYYGPDASPEAKAWYSQQIQRYRENRATRGKDFWVEEVARKERIDERAKLLQGYEGEAMAATDRLANEKRYR